VITVGPCGHGGGGHCRKVAAPLRKYGVAGNSCPVSTQQAGKLRGVAFFRSRVVEQSSVQLRRLPRKTGSAGDWVNSAVTLWVEKRSSRSLSVTTNLRDLERRSTNP